MLDHGVPSVSLSYYTAEHSFSNWGKTLFTYQILIIFMRKKINSKYEEEKAKKWRFEIYQSS
jgi:hypothetical protein